jgi:hypothetical protein
MPLTCPYTLQGPNGPKDGDACNALIDSGYQLVLIIPVYSKGILTLYHYHWLPYQIIFPSICVSLKMEFVYELSVHFTIDCS